MKTEVRRFGLTAIGLLSLSLATSGGLAKTTKAVKGAGTDSFVSASFSYDGIGVANLVTGSGRDNFGGAYTFQVIAEVVLNGAACTAPDQSAGTKYDLVQSDGVTTYKKGQVFSTAVGAQAGNQCVSSTTGSSGFSITYSATGGTGPFAAVTGTITVTGTGQTLAASGTPPGANGLFGANQFTQSGSLSD